MVPSGAALDFTSIRGAQVLRFRRSTLIFAQGEPAHSLFMVKRGRVKLEAVSPEGKQAAIELVNPGMLFGERCLAGETVRRETARALTDCTVISVGKREFEAFVASSGKVLPFIKLLLERNREYEEYLLDQLFNSSEQRLVRTLLNLAYFRRDPGSDRIITAVSHQTLAELIGTTRARVTTLMRKLEKLGLIEYHRGAICVHPSLRKWAGK